MENETIYIHYGASKFNPLIGFPVRNIPGFDKPFGGFGACRTDAKSDWKNWCECEDFPFSDEKYIKFKLAPNANIVYLRSYENLEQLPRIIPFGRPLSKFHYYIDFEGCLKMGIDAIELQFYDYEQPTGEEYLLEKNLHYILHSWGCDSIVILNPNIVQQIYD